jgi:hypothetical protein
MGSRFHMGEYFDLTKVLLGEGVKYVLLLLFSVLAIRLWRRLPILSAGRFWNNLLLACLASGIAGGIGYFSVNHSLSLLYSYYAERAFNEGHWSSSFILWQKSAKFWRNADAVGGDGVCLLLLEHPREGLELIHKAKVLRHGRNTPFEDYYQGEFYFFQSKPEKAVPLLNAASANSIYWWNIAKMLAVIQLDRNQTADAQRLMKPYVQVPVQKDECDHAYIVASFDLLDGKTNQANKLLAEFPSDQLIPFWKSRFGRLRAEIKN